MPARPRVSLQQPSDSGRLTLRLRTSPGPCATSRGAGNSPSPLPKGRGSGRGVRVWRGVQGRKARQKVGGFFPRQRGEYWGEWHKRHGRRGQNRLFGVTASSPQPSPPNKEREIGLSAGGIVKRPITESGRAQSMALLFGLCASEVSHIWTQRWGLSCISQTDYGSRGESWESHRGYMGYSWERLQPPPGLVI